MASIIISGDTSGSATLQAQAVAGNTTLTLPTTSGTLITTASGQTLTSPTITGAVMSSMASSVITSGTAVASTSGTSIDFTSIPSWVKRITVMFNGVSTNGTNNYIIQLGTGLTTYTTSGYVSSCRIANLTTGFIVIDAPSAANLASGAITLTNLTANTWVSSGVLQLSGVVAYYSAGVITLGAALTAVRITSSGTPDTFDAGSVNILYE